MTSEHRQSFLEEFEKYKLSPTPRNAGLLYLAARDYKLSGDIREDPVLAQLDDVMSKTLDGRRKFLEECEVGEAHTTVTVTFDCNRLLRLLTSFETMVKRLPAVNGLYKTSTDRIIVETLRDLVGEARNTLNEPENERSR